MKKLEKPVKKETKQKSAIIKQNISDYFMEFRKTNPPKSKYSAQNHIFLKLTEMAKEEGIDINQEITIDEPYNVIFCDIVIPDKKIAIEIDGPFHYIAKNPKKLLKIDVLG